MKLKTSLTAVILMSIYIADYFKVQDFCNFECSRKLDEILLWWFIIFGIGFIFLIVLNFLPIKFFNVWWAFAKYTTPVVVLLSTSISCGILHSSSGTWQDLLDAPIQILLCSFLILGSLIQIIRGYYQK